MVGCDESIAQTSQSHGSYMKVCPFGHHMLGTNWAQMEFVLLWLTVIKCHRKYTMKMTDLPVTTMTLMMNAWHLLRMKVNKIEGPLTHAVNAQINTIWWLIFHNIQCEMLILLWTYPSVLHGMCSHWYFKYDYTDKYHSTTMYHE